MRDKGVIFTELMHLATRKGIAVKFMPFEAYKGLLKGDRIGLKQSMGIDDKGDTIRSDMNEQYEEQADRAARMLLDVLE